MARRYIDELMDGIQFSSGGPVSISLETAKRLKALYEGCDYLERFVGISQATHRFIVALSAIREGMSEPTMSDIEQPRTRGTNDDEYQIYCEQAQALGWCVKTYDEWLNS